jgi:hypothetical protein
MASSGELKWGLPTDEHTLPTGTVSEVPESAESGQVVVVVEAAMVVVDCCRDAEVGGTD